MKKHVRYSPIGTWFVSIRVMRAISGAGSADPGLSVAESSVVVKGVMSGEVCGRRSYAEEAHNHPPLRPRELGLRRYLPRCVNDRLV